MIDDNGASHAVVLERTIDAPTTLVWQMWTEPEHFAAWYGPDGATVPMAEMDVRVGGARLICMEMATPNGTMQMWFTGVFREVAANQRLVYTESMSDEHGTVLSPAEANVPDGHPTTTEVVVELEDIGRRTKLTVTHVGVPADSPGAAGWNMALDKLITRVDDRMGSGEQPDGARQGSTQRLGER